ncbi:MAG TPA: primosomal protein N', partial [Caldilineae bacterium]|nr:primosomal protein N' [Caldilineae bacterium]
LRASGGVRTDRSASCQGRWEPGIETLVDFSPASQTFTYGISAGQRGQYKPGQVVWVPFGRTRRQGVILKLTETAPEGVEIKVLGEAITAGPALTPEQIELALWLSEHYLAPLSECIKLILPPGFGGRSEVVLEFTPGAPIYPDDLTPAQQVLLLRLRRESMLLSELRKQDRRLVKDDVLGELLRQGLVRMRDQMKGGRPKPKLVRHVQLAIPTQEIDAALMRLGRGSKQADALVWLAGQSDPEPDLDAVTSAIGSTPGPLKTLAKKGLVEITAEGRVRLAIPREQVPAAVIALRGSERYRPALETLVVHDRPIPISQFYEESGGDAALLKRLAEAEVVTITEVEVWRDPLAGRVFPPDQLPILTGDQAKAWAKITVGLDAWLGRESPDVAPPIYLLHGVTGSGKTELYLRALRRAVDAGRQGIVLVPEISLTPQTLRRFAARFPGRVAVVHSRLSDGERYDTWRRARAGEFDVVVGSRSALFTPFPNIGVVVVDEEHDTAYKQARTPRYHARDAAIELARLSGAITLLGSATPSLESSFQARRGVFTLLELPRRVMGHRLQVGDGQGSEGAREREGEEMMLELPPVEIIDMREELRAGNRSMFSRKLRKALQGVLARGEQAILFLNRRGSATFVMCRDCGHVMHCPRCAIPLTHHRGNMLICHHCNHREPMPRNCPKCGSPRFKEFGAGTQRLLDALRAEFPDARPLRWDRDATGGKTSHEDILQDFIDHRADVLVGTQMIAKGLDLPLVTLVGVLSADVGLFLPDFRAAERAFQVLTQVAGRAGRSALGGEVIFQSYHPRHYAIVAASHHDYAAFYRQEMRFRQEQGYPPYRRITRLLYLDANRERCQQETARVATQLQRRAEALNMVDFSMIGPAPAFFSKERGRFRWHLLFRSADPGALLTGVVLTPNWRIDVDPVETL